MHCAGCKNNIKDKKYIICTSVKCKKVFHHLCVNYKSSEQNETWICPDCKNAIKRVGDNSATPVRSADNVTFRKLRSRNTSPTGGTSADTAGASADASGVVEHATGLSADTAGTSGDASGSLSELTQEIRLLRAEVSSMRSELGALTGALKKCEERLDDITTNLTAQESRLLAVEAEVECLQDLKNEVEILHDKLNGQSQSMLSKDIEIQGLAETANENTDHVLARVAEAAGIKLDEKDVDFVNRVGPARTKPSDLPRPLVVRFTRRATRDKFLKAGKARHLTSKDIINNTDEPDRNLYINERLTQANRLLFRVCRIEFKKAGFKYCWTKNGTIFVKRREGRGEETFTIKRQEDIQKVLQKSSIEKQ